VQTGGTAGPGAGRPAGRWRDLVVCRSSSRGRFFGGHTDVR